jgi:hypothetical protein
MIYNAPIVPPGLACIDSAGIAGSRVFQKNQSAFFAGMLSDLAQACSCTVCFEVVDGTIWGCIDGHIMCQPCKEKWNKPCPTCRKSVETRMRPMEAIRDLLPAVCACGDMYSSRVALKEHQEGCPAVPRPCPCGQECPYLPFERLTDHVASRHSDVAIVIASLSDSWSFNILHDSPSMWVFLRGFGVFFWIEGAQLAVRVACEVVPFAISLRSACASLVFECGLGASPSSKLPVLSTGEDTYTVEVHALK